MRTVSEKYTKHSKYIMDNTDFFSTETITVPIGFRLFKGKENGKTILKASLIYTSYITDSYVCIGSDTSG